MPSISACSAASLDSRSGAKPPSSPTAVFRPRFFSVALRLWKTSAPVCSACAKRRRADRDDHELLEVHVVVRVRAAVDDVHHRHRQDPGRVAAQVAPQREVLLRGGRTSVGERDAEDGVRAQAGLVLGPVELDQLGVEALLVGRVVAGDGLGDLAVDVADGLRDALAHVGVAAVAELGGLELTGRGAGGHGRAAVSARAQRDLHLDGGVAAGVKDLARMYGFDLAHFPSRVRART